MTEPTKERLNFKSAGAKRTNFGPKKDQRLIEAEGAMYRLRTTFNQGDNRYGEYGRNVREAYDRWARTYTEITGKPAPSIYI